MRRVIRALAVSIAVLLRPAGVVAEENRIPPLRVLENVAGTDADSPRFAEFLKAYSFGENPKRKNSWGSSFGVMIGITADRKVRVGIRPPSEGTNMPVYTGQLPNGLRARDSIAAIRKKLGKPVTTKHDPNDYFEMNFDRMTVFTMNDQLFEVWLTGDQKQPNKGKLRRRRPGQDPRRTSSPSSR